MLPSEPSAPWGLLFASASFLIPLFIPHLLFPVSTDDALWKSSRRGPVEGPCDAQRSPLAARAVPEWG